MLNLVVEGANLASVLCLHLLLVGLAIQHRELHDCIKVCPKEKSTIIINVITSQVATDNVTGIVQALSNVHSFFTP
jgi:hypothetical protein